MTRAMIAGDWHGNAPWAQRVISLAAKNNIRTIFQVGDFGLWPGRSGMDFLDDVNTAARRHGITIRTLRGNHDWNEWERHVEGVTQFNFDAITEGAYVRSHIVLMPRTTRFEFGDRQVQVAGGAVSIDKAWRRPGESWWAEEELTDAEVDAIEETKVDVLLTHDCSNRTPWGKRIKPDLDSQAHRQRIDRVLAKTSPEIHFHGHMHEWYDWMNPVNATQWTQTYGLSMDGAWNSQGILDFDTLKFEAVNP